MTDQKGLPVFSKATTKITISKGDLQSAIQLWLNQKILKIPVSVIQVTNFNGSYNELLEDCTFSVDLLEEDGKYGEENT